MVALLLGITLSGFGSVSHAFPAVGDHVEFEARYEGRKIVFERSIKGRQGDTFEVRVLLRADSQILRDEQFQVPRSFLYDRGKIEHVLSTCVVREGARDRTRIGNRWVESCEFWHEDSQLTTILGAVPFGQIRFQEYLGDGVFLDFWLQRFQSGQE